jgi:hypothetical protein
VKLLKLMKRERVGGRERDRVSSEGSRWMVARSGSVNCCVCQVVCIRERQMQIIGEGKGRRGNNPGLRYSLGLQESGSGGEGS